MFWMGRNRRGMGGGLFLIPGLLFGVYAILAVLNVAGIVIGAVFSGLAAAFTGILSAAGSVFSGIGTSTGLPIGITLGIVLFYWIRNRKARSEEG